MVRELQEVKSYRPITLFPKGLAPRSQVHQAGSSIINLLALSLNVYGVSNVL
jgi:hypothetical protein